MKTLSNEGIYSQPSTNLQIYKKSVVWQGKSPATGHEPDSKKCLVCEPNLMFVTHLTHRELRLPPWPGIEPGPPACRCVTNIRSGSQTKHFLLSGSCPVAGLFPCQTGLFINVKVSQRLRICMSTFHIVFSFPWQKTQILCICFGFC